MSYNNSPYFSTQFSTAGTSAGIRRHGFKLSYVDFPPLCIDPGNVLRIPQYERFDRVVSRANQWLRENCSVRVRTCESIELKGFGGVVDSDKSMFFEAGERRNHRNMYVRGLRLWCVPREEEYDDGKIQQIGYVNVVPAQTENGQFNSFGETVFKFNQYLRQKPIPGRIINVETQEMKFRQWGNGVDPDGASWVESAKFNTSFLHVIRVFYEVGKHAYEEIGCADFVPDPISNDVHSMKYETFGEVLDKARDWVGQQTGIRITNVQSIDYKLSHEGWDGTVDTHRTFFTEYSRHVTHYMRIIRISFVKCYTGDANEYEPLLQLNYKTFEPLSLSMHSVFGIPQCESQSQTMRRAIDWLNHTEVKVIAAETVPVRLHTGNQRGNHEITYTFNPRQRHEIWVFVLRIYLDGDYVEPPASVLLPPPKISGATKKKSSCSCAIL